MIIGFTKKLADTSKIKVAPYNVIDGDPFYEWQAELFWFDRKKGVLLMNNKVGYCIVMYGLKMEHFKQFDKISLTAIQDAFLAEGYPQKLVSRYIEKCGSVKYTKSLNRSILGQLRDPLYLLPWTLENYVPCESIYVVNATLELNETIIRYAHNYSRPKEFLMVVMKELSEENHLII